MVTGTMINEASRIAARREPFTSVLKPAAQADTTLPSGYRDAYYH
jgi:hypothetical protein